MSEKRDRSEETTSETQTSLEEARLQIGDVVQLQSQSEEGEQRYAVRLIGISKGRSVLVHTPMADGNYLFMREGRSFVLRAFSGKSAFAFTTSIVKNVNVPFPYLHLAYPRTVRSLVVRRGARAAVKVVCAITAREGVPIQAAGTIVNISVGGALIAMKAAPGKKDERLKMSFKVSVNGIESILELDAVIRAINMLPGDESGTPCQLGVQFVDVAAGDSIPLLAFIYHELLEQSLGA